MGCCGSRKKGMKSGETREGFLEEVACKLRLERQAADPSDSKSRLFL